MPPSAYGMSRSVMYGQALRSVDQKVSAAGRGINHVRVSCLFGHRLRRSPVALGAHLRIQHQPSSDQLRRVGSFLRDEFVHPPTVPAYDVEVAFLIDVHLMWPRQPAHETASRATVGPEVVLELTTGGFTAEPQPFWL